MKRCRALAQRENWPILAVMTLALFLRLWCLSDRPLHHDESMHAVFSYQIAKAFRYSYEPFLHGPFMYYVTAVIYILCGTVNDFVARLGPALAGTAICLLPWLLRGALGTYGAISASLMIAISPTMLYFSRFLRHDIYSLLLHAITLLAVLHYEKNRKAPALIVAALCMTCSFANHELTYISLFMLGVYTACTWRNSRQFFKTYHRHFLGATIAALVAYTLLFSSFFTHWQGWLDGLPNPFSKTTSLGYWLSQHGVKRGGQPIYYYLLLLIGYEFVALGLFLVAIKNNRRFKNNRLLQFILFWAVSSLVMYSWAGERMPWLLMHPLLPMLLLAGWVIEGWVQQKRYLLLTIATAFLLISSFFSVRLNYQNGANPHEMLVYVQSSPDVFEVAKLVHDLRATPTDKTRVILDDELSWPLAWYLRKENIVAFEKNPLSHLNSLPPAQVLLVHADSRHDIPRLPAPWRYVGHYALRSWWVPDANDYRPTSLQNIRNLLIWWWNREVVKGDGDLVFALFRAD